MDLTPQQWIDLILDRAEKLRKAGVKTMTIDGFSVELEAAQPEAEIDLSEDDKKPAVVHRDALDDPDTFGGRVPTWEREDMQ